LISANRAHEHTQRTKTKSARIDARPCADPGRCRNRWAGTDPLRVHHCATAKPQHEPQSRSPIWPRNNRTERVAGRCQISISCASFKHQRDREADPEERRAQPEQDRDEGNLVHLPLSLEKRNSLVAPVRPSRQTSGQIVIGKRDSEHGAAASVQLLAAMVPLMASPRQP